MTKSTAASNITAMRRLLTRLITQSQEALDGEADDRIHKSIASVALLAKTIRESEAHKAANTKPSANTPTDYTGADLAARLKGYVPTQDEEAVLDEKLRLYLTRRGFTVQGPLDVLRD